jgi:hypothetical protein
VRIQINHIFFYDFFYFYLGELLSKKIGISRSLIKLSIKDEEYSENELFDLIKQQLQEK